jgi:hypothetical protein
MRARICAINDGFSMQAITRSWPLQSGGFPIAFLWFGEPGYWQDKIPSLGEQPPRMQEQAIPLPDC